MAQLIVRNLEDKVKRRLRQRAKNHGRSMEEEARVIIRAAVSAKESLHRRAADAEAPQEGLGTRLMKLFANVPPEFKIEEM